HTLAQSFALAQSSTLLFPMDSALFAQNHPGVGRGSHFCPESAPRNHESPAAAGQAGALLTPALGLHDDFRPAGEDRGGEAASTSQEECQQSDYFNEVGGRALLGEQGQNGSVHRCKLAPLVHGKPQQVGVSDLLVADQPPDKRLSSRNKTDFVDPKTMRGVIQVSVEELHCFLWCYRVARKRRVGDDS